MSTYEVLDHIADAYTPLLFIYCIVLSVRWRMTGQPFIWVKLLFSAVVVYGLQYLDAQMGIWPALALDYSTHTAAAFALAVYAAHQSPLKSIHTKTLITTLVSYMGLMLYQQYHTLADIITTAFAVALCLAILYGMGIKALKNVVQRQTIHNQKTT